MIVTGTSLSNPIDHLNHAGRPPILTNHSDRIHLLSHASVPHLVERAGVKSVPAIRETNPLNPGNVSLAKRDEGVALTNQELNLLNPISRSPVKKILIRMLNREILGKSDYRSFNVRQAVSFFEKNRIFLYNSFYHFRHCEVFLIQ